MEKYQNKENIHEKYNTYRIKNYNEYYIVRKNTIVVIILFLFFKFPLAILLC